MTEELRKQQEIADSDLKLTEESRKQQELAEEEKSKTKRAQWKQATENKRELKRIAEKNLQKKQQENAKINNNKELIDPTSPTEFRHRAKEDSKGTKPKEQLVDPTSPTELRHDKKGMTPKKDKRTIDAVETTDNSELYSTTFSDDGQTYLWNNGIESQPAVIEEEEEPFELQKQVTAALAAVPNMIAPLIEEIPWLLPRWTETESSKKRRACLDIHYLLMIQYSWTNMTSQMTKRFEHSSKTNRNNCFNSFIVNKIIRKFICHSRFVCRRLWHSFVSFVSFVVSFVI